MSMRERQPDASEEELSTLISDVEKRDIHEEDQNMLKRSDLDDSPALTQRPQTLSLQYYGRTFFSWMLMSCLLSWILHVPLRLSTQTKHSVSLEVAQHSLFLPYKLENQTWTSLKQYKSPSKSAESTSTGSQPIVAHCLVGGGKTFYYPEVYSFYKRNAIKPLSATSAVFLVLDSSLHVTKQLWDSFLDALQPVLIVSSPSDYLETKRKEILRYRQWEICYKAIQMYSDTYNVVFSSIILTDANSLVYRSIGRASSWPKDAIISLPTDFRAFPDPWMSSELDKQHKQYEESNTLSPWSPNLVFVHPPNGMEMRGHSTLFNILPWNLSAKFFGAIENDRTFQTEPIRRSNFPKFFRDTETIDPRLATALARLNLSIVLAPNLQVRLRREFVWCSGMNYWGKDYRIYESVC